MNVAPPPEGFWKLGELDKTHINNPYKYTTNKMAPFDQEVGFPSFQLMFRNISYKADFFFVIIGKTSICIQHLPNKIRE